MKRTLSALILLLLSFYMLSAQDTSRGKYFYKKMYSLAELPDYERSRGASVMV